MFILSTLYCMTFIGIVAVAISAQPSKEGRTLFITVLATFEYSIINISVLNILRVQ